ncbi:MAG TPA: DUF5777 family beta-barrel protein [Balneolaceae bacterium]
MIRSLSTALFFFLILTTALPSYAQIERERANIVEPVDAFSATNLITQPTTYQLPASNLKSTIMHSFGIATDDAIRNFFGLDNVQNVRLGIDVGITDHWSVGIGRSSQLNVVDLRTKISIISQNTSGANQFSLSLKGDVGVVTQENNIPFEEDISALVSAIFSKKFDVFSLQIAPMYAHFNDAEDGTDLFAIGIGSELQLSERYSLIAEYYPVLGDRPAGAQNAFSLGLNIQTGGHVFQLFLTSTEWHLEQYILLNNDNQFWAGDFRFGFNINRVFGL